MTYYLAAAVARLSYWSDRSVLLEIVKVLEQSRWKNMTPFTLLGGYWAGGG